MQKFGRYRATIVALIIAENLIFINVLFVTLRCCFDTGGENISYEWLQILINLGYLTSFVVVKVEGDFRRWRFRELLKTNFYQILIVAIVVVGCLFVLKFSADVSRLFIMLFFGIAFIAMIGMHVLTRQILRITINSEKRCEKAIILGAGVLGLKIYAELTQNKYLGIRVAGLFDDDTTKTNSAILGTIKQAKEYAVANHISKVYSTIPLSAKDKIIDFMNFSEQHIIQFYIVPQVGYYTNTPVVLEYVGDMPIFSVRKVALSNWHNTAIKRTLDILFSLLFLATLFPLIYAVLAILIKIGSPGPVFFVQERTGFKGKKFKCYKFRSMKCNQEAHTLQATAYDKRKTRIGNFIRRTNLDELPQFINVLKGDMSIVGPRPHMLLHTEEYSRLIRQYMVRHFIKPGITGWAQINGFRGETNKLEEMEGRIKKDIWYIENWSVLLDMEIIVKTALLMFKRDKKAY
ncbi:MAG: undecaprenyl-phosphate glucose phosphotransferase [Prevotellaceae bacterium]|jgi:putative colanic acid biosynthesis UDP-glucose lipid carrier transferase|nr:undecaprenyl-phosphate glucose phosphotransferase [Prevotellaceae bacterium]